MRSKLFVPGSRPELFAKALAGDADAISIDFEDSVVDSRKAEARTLTAEFLQSPEARATDKIIVVRCNALGTEHFDADVLAITGCGVELLNLPKIECADEVRAAIEVLERVEESNGADKPVQLLVNIESAAGLRRVAEIATAHSRVVGLQLGLNDLFESLGVDRTDTANVHAAMFAMRMAAGEAGVPAYDGAYPDIQNRSGFRAEADMARRLGYRGKTCIHPCQVAWANEVFVAGEDDVAFALRVLAASERAASEGAGAFTVDGKMIDRPAIRRAGQIVAMSQRPSGVDKP